MAKLARNAPCPCGSGKKYKRCCGASGRVAPPAAPTVSALNLAPSGSSAAPVAGGDGVRLFDNSPQMPPYAAAKWFENEGDYARLKRKHPRRARRLWVPSKVARLDTQALLARLVTLGVHTSREAFAALAREHDSAWALAQRHWAPALGARRAPEDLELLGLAACELWKRWCPERPSLEMLDDAMQVGYRHMMARDSVRACACWQEVWAHIHARLRPQMRTVQAAAVAFDGTQSLFNWLQDFALELYNACLTQPEHARDGQQLCQQVLEQFPDEDQRLLMNFRADLGEFLYLAGEEAEGERVLLALIDDHPQSAVGYLRLAQLLAHGPSPERGPIDPNRAQALLEQALAKPVIDAADSDLQSRLDELRKASA